MPRGSLPVAIDNDDHTSSNATMLEKTVTYECHSGHSLEAPLLGAGSFTTQRVVLRQVDPWQSFLHLAAVRQHF